MITFAGDKKIYETSRIIEMIEPGMGIRFIMTYYEKNDSIPYVSKIQSIRNGKSYNIKFSDLAFVINLENKLSRIEPILQNFLQSVKNAKSKSTATAPDIRDAEQQVFCLLKELNSIFSNKSVVNIYHRLLELFPNKAKGKLETLFDLLSAYYAMNNGSGLKIDKGIKSVIDFFGKLRFSSQAFGDYNEYEVDK